MQRRIGDTGADNTILPESVARDLGIPMTRATGPAARAFGGQEISLFCADVELELARADGRLRSLAHVYFPAAGMDKETIILGQQGFLDYFTATFMGEKRILDLEPSSYLPRLADAQ